MAVYDKEDSHQHHDTLVRDAASEEVEDLQALYDSPSAGAEQGYYQRGKDYARNSAAQNLEERGLLGAVAANKVRGKSAGSGLGKKLGIAAAVIFLPGILFTLMLFALQTGLRIEQIDRVSTNLRFASFHSQLSSRLKHLAATSIAFDGDLSSASATYSRSSIGQRLLGGGFTPQAAIRSLGLEGDFEITTRRGITGNRISSITDRRTGVVYDGNSISDLQAWREVADQRLVGESARGRFFTRRTTNFVFKQAALPFARYQSIIDDLRSGTISRSAVPQAVATEDIDLIDPKTQDIDTPLGGEDDVDEFQDAVREGTDPDIVQDNIARRLRASEAIFSATSKGSFAAAVGTFACVARNVSSQIQDTFRLRIEGSASSAAKIKTLTSQIKGDDIHPDIIDQVSQDVEGFQNSATYKAGVGRADEVSAIYDFSDRFSNVKVHGIPISLVLQVSDAIDSVTGAQFLEEFGERGENLADFTGDSVDSVCENVILTTEGQIAITGVELVGTLVGSFFSGGGAAAGQSAARATLTTFLSSAIRTKTLASTAASIGFEYWFFNHFLPDAINNVSGLETVFGANPGEQNYASIDYGFHYLKEADCIANGCSRVPVEDFIASTESQLALQRQEYADGGIWDNIASTDNPYSIATQIAISTPTDVSEGIKTTASALGGILSPSSYGDLFGLSSASAQSLDSSLLLPGQTTSLGFNEDEINGTAEGFSHIENTEFVVNNLDNLREEFGECLSIDVVDYFLAEAGVDPEDNYPSKCDTERGRRYKIYYQDCLAIEQVIATGENSSSFFNESCGDLAPGQDIDTTDNRVSKNIQLLTAINSSSRPTKYPPIDNGDKSGPNRLENIARIFVSWRGQA